MADEKERGSEESESGSSETTNSTAKITLDQISAENAALKLKIEEQQKIIDGLTKQLKEANDILEARAKENEIRRILPRSNLSIEILGSKPLEELRSINATLDQVKLPTYKNIHLQLVAGDQNTDRDTVGDLSVVTEAKRKGGRI